MELINTQILNRSQPNGFVTLPFDEDQFKNFISSLLGKPQTIDAILENDFELNRDELVHIVNCIDQRISQQNDCKLISLNSRIDFSDETSVSLNSLDQLLSYSEIKPIISESVHLTMIYLIKFKNKEIFERQEINISFLSNSNTRKRFNSSIPFLLTAIEGNSKTAGVIQYSIKHTERTWGTDIDALLSNLLKGLTKQENKILNWFRKLNGLLYLSIVFLSTYYGSKIGTKITNDKIFEYNILLKNIFSKKSTTYADLDTKIKFLAENVMNNVESYTFTLGFFGFFIGGFLGLILLAAVENNRIKSYILFTKDSFKNKELSEKRYVRSWIIFVLSLLISIVCNIASSYIYDYFK